VDALSLVVFKARLVEALGSLVLEMVRLAALPGMGVGDS